MFGMRRTWGIARVPSESSMLDSSDPGKRKELPAHQLKVKLTRLLRVKEELRDEYQPVPPKLEEEIREVSEALNQPDPKE